MTIAAGPEVKLCQNYRVVASRPQKQPTDQIRPWPNFLRVGSNTIRKDFGGGGNGLARRTA